MNNSYDADMPGEKPELFIHEWLAVLSFLGTLAVLSFVALSRADPIPLKTGSPHYMIDPKIEVFVQGAVKNPGMKTTERGATLAEVLSLAEPLPEADLKKVKEGSKVRQGQVIKIPFKKIPKERLAGKERK